MSALVILAIGLALILAAMIAALIKCWFGLDHTPGDWWD